MKKLYCYIAQGTDPYQNLAAEKYLLETLGEKELILYLWQNAHTVVIGKNQNAWAECRCALLQEEGGKLARRSSGGGAVYHDLGNLNFTFLCNEADHDLQLQFQTIKKACALAGIETELSGRNDLLAGGKKFSGNAFYHSKGKTYHHGTLLIDTDPEKLARYLTPPKAKLQAKGVQSVRSRVVNLKELAPDLSIEKMKGYMVRAFEETYGDAAFLLPPIPRENLDPHARELADPTYLFGASPACDIALEERFDWGSIQLNIAVQKGRITATTVYTDAMDHALADRLQTALVGQPFEAEALNKALADLPCGDDLFGLLSNAL